MPTGYAGRKFWKSPAHAYRDANVSAVSSGADRHNSAKRVGRARRSRCRGIARNASGYARIARPLAYLQQHSADDHVSPRVLAAKPGAVRKTQSLGRHASSHGAARAIHKRAAAELFPIAVSLCEARWTLPIGQRLQIGAIKHRVDSLARRERKT